MSAQHMITRSAIAQLETMFDEAPEVEPDEVRKTEAIRMLAPKIHQMAKKGYTWPRIVQMMAGKGIDVSVDTLKAYVARPKATSQKRHQARAFASRAADSHATKARAASERASGRCLPPAGPPMPAATRAIDGGETSRAPAASFPNRAPEASRSTDPASPRSPSVVAAPAAAATLPSNVDVGNQALAARPSKVTPANAGEPPRRLTASQAVDDHALEPSPHAAFTQRQGTKNP